jgi:hypothetical protein
VFSIHFSPPDSLGLPRDIIDAECCADQFPAALVGQAKSGLTEHLSGLFVDGFILKELFFSLEPVVQFRTGLITSPDVEFVGPSPDSFFG